MIRKLLTVYFVFHISLLPVLSLEFGKIYRNPDDPMSVVFYENRTLFDWTMRKKDSLISNTEDVRSRFSDFYGIKKLETVDNTGKSKIYFVLGCTIDATDFVMLLQTTTTRYRNWVIPYTYHDFTKINYIRVPILWRVSVQNALAHVRETYKNETVDYLPKYLGLFSIPWAVSAAEKAKSVTFVCRSASAKYDFEPVKELVVVNGFVCVEKASLYTENARAKNIKISYNDVSFTYELRDCANFQVIPLPEKIQPEERTAITLEIIDTYKGDKYQDVVISGIYFPEIHVK